MILNPYKRIRILQNQLEQAQNENFKLQSQNELLKAVTDSLRSFRRNFDDFYTKLEYIPTVHVSSHLTELVHNQFITKQNGVNIPPEIAKQNIAKEMAKSLIDVIEWDVVEGMYAGDVVLQGRLKVAVPYTKPQSELSFDQFHRRLHEEFAQHTPKKVGDDC